MASVVAELFVIVHLWPHQRCLTNTSRNVKPSLPPNPIFNKMKHTTQQPIAIAKLYFTSSLTSSVSYNFKVIILFLQCTSEVNYSIIYFLGVLRIQSVMNENGFKTKMCMRHPLPGSFIDTILSVNWLIFFKLHECCPMQTIKCMYIISDSNLWENVHFKCSISVLNVVSYILISNT